MTPAERETTKTRVNEGRTKEMEKIGDKGEKEGGKEGRRKGREEERKEGRKEGRKDGGREVKELIQFGL